MRRSAFAAAVVACVACNRPEVPAPAVDAPDAAALPSAGQEAPPAAQARCSVDPFVAGWPALLERANKGERVVTVNGCSLFDGALLVRGWNATADDLASQLVLNDACEATLKLPQGEVTLALLDGQVWVSRMRNVTDAALVEQEKEAGAALDAALIQAARCPAAQHRLKTQEDAAVAMSYALAAGTLQRLLADGSVPEPAVVDAMGKVCASPAATVAAPTPAPFAAMARMMAGSFSVFGNAAGQVKAKDAGLTAVLPAAQKVLKDAPTGNLQGVCATWDMARAVQAAVVKAKAKGGKAPSKGAQRRK